MEERKTMKMLKRIICIAVTAAVLIGLMPLAENVKAEEEYLVSLCFHYVSESKTETSKTVQIPITISNTTTWGEVWQYAEENNMIPEVPEFQGVSFTEWLINRTNPAAQLSLNDVILTQNDIEHPSTSNGKKSISANIVAEYDKTFIKTKPEDGGLNCLSGEFFDDTATVVDVVTFYNNNIEDKTVAKLDDSVVNPQVVLWDGNTDSNATVDTLSVIGGPDIYYPSLGIKLAADNSIIKATFTYYTKDFSGAEYRGTDSNGNIIYSHVPNKSETFLIGYESGDKYIDLISRTGITVDNPTFIDGMRFVCWVNNNKEELNANVSGSNAGFTANYNYKYVAYGIFDDVETPDGLDYGLHPAELLHGEFALQGWTETKLGQTITNNNAAWLPTDKDLTYSDIIKDMPKNHADAIKYSHIDEMDTVVVKAGEMIDRQGISRLYLSAAKAYHSSDWETIWAGEYVFPDSKGEDNGGSTYEPVRPTDAQIQEVVAQIVELENTATDANKESLTIDMKQNDGSIATVVPVEILEQIKGKNIDVTLDMGEYSWTINGKNVTADTLKDINLEVKIGNKGYWPDSFDDKYSKERLEMVRNSNPFLCMSLTHDGEFGFEATLNINVGTAYSGKYGNLYYFNDGFLEFISAAKVDANGNASLAFTHASDYAIVISDASAAPDTGDHSNIGLYTLLAVIAAAGITSTIIYKKKAFER